MYCTKTTHLRSSTDNSEHIGQLVFYPRTTMMLTVTETMIEILYISIGNNMEVHNTKVAVHLTLCTIVAKIYK